MKRKLLVVLGIVAILTLVIVSAVQASTQSDLAKVHDATAQFNRPEAAKGAQYDLVEGLDYCFNAPGTGCMGLH